ncbi:MAG: ExbD/TolR family protein [Roseimicrobium sp.]
MKLVSHLPKESFWLYLGPVLNVLLVLLMFFLLGSSFVIQSGVSVKLPESASRLTGFDRAQVITATANGSSPFYFNGLAVTVDELRKGLEGKKKESHRAIVHADEMAPSGRLVQAANIALALGYEVAFATQPMR